MTEPTSGRFPSWDQDAYYEDATGFLWRWSSTSWADGTEHYQWFPQAYTGPGPVPHPTEPMTKVYGRDGYRVKSDAPCGDTLRFAGYTNVCDLPTGHQGRHHMTQPGNEPVIWSINKEATP